MSTSDKLPPSSFELLRSRGCIGCLSIVLLFVGYVLWAWFYGDNIRNRRRVNAEILADAEAFRCDPSNKVAFDRIVHHLHSNWWFAAMKAAVALGELGPLALPAAKDLIWALNCGDMFVEGEAARALGPVTRGTDIAVDPLISKVEVEADLTPYGAVESLGIIGEPALKAIPLLERMSKHRIEAMAHTAQKSLKQLRQVQDANKQRIGSPQH